MEYKRLAVEFKGTASPASAAAAVIFRGVDSLTGTKETLSPREDQNEDGGAMKENFSLSGTVITGLEFNADGSIVEAVVMRGGAIYMLAMPGVTIVTDNLGIEDGAGMKGRNSPLVGIDSEGVVSVTRNERFHPGPVAAAAITLRLSAMMSV